MKAIIILFLLASISLSAPAQQASPRLPETTVGERVAAYVKAFNSGAEETMRAFITANVSENAIKRRSIDERLQVYKEMLGNMKSLELNRVLESTPSTITCLFKTGAGEWVEIGFQFEEAPPHKLLGLRVEDAEPPSDAKTSITPSAITQPPMSEDEIVAAVESRMNELVAADQFSGTVLIGRKGSAIFQKAYGLASKEYSVANRVDTKFNLGSINKLFTQIAIGQLAEQGKLSFDDKLSKHLADYPNRGVAERITIRQLLTMTSGVGDIFGERFDLLAKDKLRSLKDFIPLFADQPLAFEPGSRQQYSNGGYVLLGAIIERLSGQSYYDYVRERIFKVAGMQNTDSYEADVPISNLASGYTLEGSANGIRRNNIYSRPARGSSAGGGYSTAEDLLKLTIAVTNGKIRIPDFRNTNTVGTGQAKPIPGVGIAGGAPGSNALFDFNPTTGYSIIVMSNYDPPSAEAVGKEIRRLLARIKS